MDHQKSKRIPKKIYFCFIYNAKAFDCVDHKKLWKLLQEMGIPDLLTCLLEICMQVKKQQLELDMKQQTGSSILSPCLFNLSAEHNVWNARMDKA